jgi:hypothetical protein
MRAEAHIEPSGVSELIVFAWGTAGVTALLGQAIYRLTPQALEPLVHGNLTPFQVALYVGWVLFAGYTEGYRAFQGRFSPRVVARAVYLAKNRDPWHVALAPLFCMSFFHATRRGLIAAWTVTLLVLVAVMIVRQLPQPWRGIVDGGVVVGLSWGTLAIFANVIQVFRGVEPRVSNEVPS